MPCLTTPSCSWGSVKSTNVPSMLSSVVIVAPGARYWPRFTARMPSLPGNGARTILRSSWAWIAPTSAIAVWSAVSSRSSCCCGSASFATSTRERRAVSSAFASRARADASCARSGRASSSTRTWPRFTTSPESKPSRTTRPGASLLTATLLTPLTLPTAARLDSHVFACATAELTASGGGPAAFAWFPNPISFAIWAPLMPPIAAMTSTRPAMTSR
jgi:hypothetical protein